MAARVDRGELPGIVTLVARGGDVRVDAIGVTAVPDTPGYPVGPMRRDTVFRIASMTKPVLAVVTMMLVEDGLLALDEPVDRLLPELAHPRVLARIDGPLDDTVPADRPVTVEDLLTFRMGHGHLFEPSFDPPFPIVETPKRMRLTLAAPDPRTPHGPDEWMRLFGSLPLMYQPGERWQYNVGSLVLGVLVARAAGRPLGEVFAERLFTPLGMTHTGFHLPADQVHRLPAFYLVDPGTGRLTPKPVSSPDEWSKPPVFPSGAGGLVSTVDDFLAFARLLLHRGVHRGTRLLSERSVELMTTNRLTPGQIATAGPILAGQGWGYGMSVVTAPDDVTPTPGRYGWAGGYGTDWFTDPHEGLIAVAMTQVVDFLWNGGMAEFVRLAYR
jgi:CubicO group peptidase (beta-lactamase class C family)